MSYDIEIYRPNPDDPDDDGSLGGLNWLRNPFGLCDFAEDNVGDGNRSLWHVCNDHSYDAVANLDRAEFLRVVLDYWDRLRGLEHGYCYFALPGYVQFSRDYGEAMTVPDIHARMKMTPAECDAIYKWSDDHSRIGFNVNRFAKYRQHFSWRDTEPLQFYKDWFQRLVNIAQAMQDPAVHIYISN